MNSNRDELDGIGVALVARDGTVRAMDPRAAEMLSLPGGNTAPRVGDLVSTDVERLLSPGSRMLPGIAVGSGRVLWLSATPLGDDLAVRIQPIEDPEANAERERAAERLAAAVSRRTIEQAFQRNREFLSTLVNASPLGIVSGDLEGVIRSWNPAAARLLGWPAEEVLGRSARELWPELATLTTDTIAKVVAGEAATIEVPFRRRDGRELVLDATTVGFSGGDGVPIGVISVFSDVTARVRAAEAQRRLTANMMDMDRMIAVGTLAAGVAHEINNPLAYVVANLEFADAELGLLSGSSAKEIADVRAALADARTGARRVRDIVRDLKTFSHQDEDVRRSIDPRAALESAISLAWNEIRHRATLVREIGETPAVYASESRLGQLFLNLLVNAAHAIPEGSADAHRIVVRARTDAAGAAVVEIEDTGCGIAPEILPRIFDPFFTTKPVGQGTGLGLSICRGIVTAAGGTLDVATEPGRGTTFRVTLPSASRTDAATGN